MKKLLQNTILPTHNPPPI